jgi:hypothetical protein
MTNTQRNRKRSTGSYLVCSLSFVVLSVTPSCDFSNCACG